MHVAGRRGIDGNSPRLHGFRDFPDQFDLQQAVLERGAVHLNIIGQVKLPLERPRGNAPVEIFAFGSVRLISLDGHRVLLGSHRDFVGCKARNRKRNLVAILAETFDVVGRIVVLAGTLCRFNEVEKAVEANGRTPQGGEVVSAHSQILQGAKWIRTTPDTAGARLSFPTLWASGTPPLGGSGKIKKARFGFKRGSKIFWNPRRLPLRPSPRKNGGGRRRCSDYTFDPWIASITASVTSFVVAVPPTSGVSTPAAHTFSTAAINRVSASFSPRCSSICAPVQNVATGLAMPLPVMSNAEPWIGSNIEGKRRCGSILPVGATPRLPASAPARSERMSACKLVATMVSRLFGCSVMRTVMASTSILSQVTSGNSAATSAAISSHITMPWRCAFDLVTTVRNLRGRDRASSKA